MDYPTASMNKKKRKSEPLGKDELESLKVYRLKFDTEVECAIKIGVDRTVLNRLLLTGSASPETIKKVRVAIGYFGLNNWRGVLAGDGDF